MFVLVTGANGFLGRYVVEAHLARGDRVRAMVRRPQPMLEELGAEIAIGDLRDRAAVFCACENIDAVQHVAAVPGVWGPWEHYYDANVLGTLHLLDACHAHGVGRLAFTSSPSVTFNGTNQDGVDESTAYSDRWLCHYPHTKAIAEREVLSRNNSQTTKGTLFTCALRPHLIWGPRDSHLIPRLIERARSGRLRQVGDGKNLIDTIFVENAADAQLLAVDRLEPGSPVCGQAYFLSQDEPVECWSWINSILELAGLPPVEKKISADTAWNLGATLEAAWGTLRLPGEPPMTRFVAAQLSTSHYFNIEKAKQQLGYSPRISTQAGLNKLREDLAVATKS